MPIQHKGVRQQKTKTSSAPKIPILARITLFNENRADISNSFIPYTIERAFSVTANSPRNGIKADTIHKVFFLM